MTLNLTHAADFYADRDDESPRHYMSPSRQRPGIAELDDVAVGMILESVGGSGLN